MSRPPFWDQASVFSIAILLSVSRRSGDPEIAPCKVKQ
jgi:hypothetical protein